MVALRGVFVGLVVLLPHDPPLRIRRNGASEFQEGKDAAGRLGMAILRNANVTCSFPTMKQRQA